MAKKTISVGNFSSGMLPDVIGAADSMALIQDGWIPRIGEIRKRGGKTQVEVLGGGFESSYRAGAKNSELIAPLSSPLV